ncbi:regulator of G-protein signaling 22 [Thalassophryne amazonica]|uniref:regulator of G-protein signaling 22 n=1 Tax=Thalassophryne amazonica TaxID=390379 RepID=UPI001471CDF2|nr:regulator of G-protein signaling 22 [Thalassophryne amazonica]
MRGVLLSEPPHLSEDSFVNTLSSDDTLVHFFNKFLSLPSFPEALLYNRDTGLFEVMSEEAEVISKRIRSVLHHSKSQLAADDPTALARSPLMDNTYTVCCLDRNEGIQWIMKERLPYFLQSDYYYKYRLAMLFSQWDTNLCVCNQKRHSCKTSLSATHLHLDKENNNISAKQGCMRTHTRKGTLSSSFLLKHEQLQSPQVEFSITKPPAAKGEQELIISSKQSSESAKLDQLAAGIVKQVIRAATKVIIGLQQTTASDCLSESQGLTARANTAGSSKCNANRCSAGENALQDCKDVSGGEEKTEMGEGKRGTEQDICCCGVCCLGSGPGLDEFKEFLHGRPGEKLLNLWMDIERLKDIKHREWKKRFLALMRTRYLLRSCSSLNVELLSRLGLTTSPCWTEERLCSVQPCVIESLLFYWAPRFLTSLYRHEFHDNTFDMGLWTQWAMMPSTELSYRDHMTPPPCRPSTCLLWSPHTAQIQLSCSRTMDQMLQALCVDSCAGLYFAQFCEQSVNQLWENAVHLWMDLQYYYELFHQGGLDPYRVQREAQLLYSTYLHSSARRNVGINEEVRREVYSRLTPAVEELFDKVVQHILNVLLEPWTLLVNRDRESFQQVGVQEDVRKVDSEEFRQLQNLYEETKKKLKQSDFLIIFYACFVTRPFNSTYSVFLGQVEECTSSIPAFTPSSAGSRRSDSWASVSPHYQGYRLGSLLRDHQEIRHFMSFLQNQDSSIHLSCWLDLEQYRRTPKRNKTTRHQRWAAIGDKYLNRKYFFGTKSPASTQQWNHVLHLAGGPERLKTDCVSDPLVVEIQNVIRSHIENTWLPRFLSTPAFTERQKHKPKGAEGANVYHRHRRRGEAEKVVGLWMSSSKEILMFRQVLLNPVTSLQFQYFASLKSDFLENDVLFWLEVQKYKDLCHSHSSEVSIQQKISTIISCFIDSSVPPALQIDITAEQARHILENRRMLGPYIFREAQVTVFNELLKLWSEFQALRSSVQEEQLLPLLEEKRGQHRARLRRRRRKEEEEEEERRAVQEELERKEASWEEEMEDEGDEEGIEKELIRTPSGMLFSFTQPLSWSYSKYMAGLKREEALLRRQSPTASLSTVSGESAILN